MTTREGQPVELVDADGAALGSTTVADAHQAPGRLHRAFSVFLRDPDGRVLLQQRAAGKTRFPLRWANTCCGHPSPGETPSVAAARRLTEELGLDFGADDFVEVGVYSYYAEDPATGRVEYEYDHVLLRDVPAEVVPRPDPAEVAAVRWVRMPTLLSELGAGGAAYAPWLPGVTRSLAEHLARPARQREHPSCVAGPSSTVATESPERSGGR